jgi:hypothetical protein
MESECNNLDIETEMEYIKKEILELQIFKEIFKNIPGNEQANTNTKNKILKLAKIHVHLAYKRADNEKGGKRRICVLTNGMSDCKKCAEKEV